MAAGGDHQVAGAQLTAGVEHQACDLLTQLQCAVDVVVIQARHVLPSADPGQAAQQGLDGWRGDVRHATAQLHDVLAWHGADQFQHQVPLGNIDRALGRAANHGQLRQLAPNRDEVAGFRFRSRQPAVFQHPVSLLHRTQADPVLNTQCPYRRQSVTGAIEALFDACAEQFGEVDVKRHGAASVKRYGDQYRWVKNTGFSR
ncbi:hypothetical protein D3C85_754340 [compost metagenome]